MISAVKKALWDIHIITPYVTDVINVIYKEHHFPTYNVSQTYSYFLLTMSWQILDSS